MSILEIIIYSLLGATLLGFCFKWFIYDLVIKPRKKAKKIKLPNEEDEDIE